MCQNFKILYPDNKFKIFTSYAEFNINFNNNYDILQYFYTNGIKLLNFKDIKNYGNSNIRIFPRLKGGNLFDDIMENLLDPILSIFDEIFSPIARPLENIGSVFIFLIRLLIWFINVLIWAVFFIIYLLEVLLIIPQDFLTSLLAIVSSLLLAIPQTLINFIKIGTEYFIKYIVSGFWGWDKIPSNANDYKKNKYWKNKRNGKNKDKCYRAKDGSIPFNVLLGTILMPPIGVFMTHGLTGWLQILISILLTLAFYIPGLIYSLLIIYS